MISAHIYGLCNNGHICLCIWCHISCICRHKSPVQSGMTSEFLVAIASVAIMVSSHIYGQSTNMVSHKHVWCNKHDLDITEDM